MMNQQNLTICQINLNNQKNLIQIYEHLLNKKFDIVCAQEPYFYRNIFSSQTFVLKSEKDFRCATFYKSTNLQVFDRSSETNSHFVVSDISLDNSIFTLINCYFPPPSGNNVELIENVKTNLRLLIQKYSDKPCLFVGDFNAKSRIWNFDPVSAENERGDWLLSQIIHNCYSVLNDTDQGPTFSSHIGSSSVDISFANRSFFDLFEYSWQIDNTLNCDSDHRPIILQISSKSLSCDNLNSNDLSSTLFNDFPFLKTIQNYNLNKINETIFKECFSSKLNVLPSLNSKMEIDTFVRDWINAVHFSTIQSSITKQQLSSKPYWWDDEINRKHKKKSSSLCFKYQNK